MKSNLIKFIDTIDNFVSSRIMSFCEKLMNGGYEKQFRLLFNVLVLFFFVMWLVLLFSSDVFAAEKAKETKQSLDIVSKMLTEFQTKTKAWTPILTQYAALIFTTLCAVDIAFLGIKNSLKQAELGELFAEFTMLIIFATIMWGVLNNHNYIGNLLITHFDKLAIKASGIKNMKMNPTDILAIGGAILGKILDEMTLYDPTASLLSGLCGIAIMVTFTFIAALVVIVKCESYILLNAGIVLLGFGGMKYTRDYAITFIKYTVGIALKLFVMQLLIGLSMSFMDGFVKMEAARMQDVIVVLAASMIILLLVKTIPDTLAQFVTGPLGTSAASALGGTVGMVAGGTVLTLKAMKMSATGAVDAAKGAGQVASGIQAAVRYGANMMNGGSGGSLPSAKNSVPSSWKPK